MHNLVTQQTSSLRTVFNKRDYSVFGVIVCAWIILQYIFWNWWLSPGHITSTMRMVINSVLLAWTGIMPAYFFFFVARMKRPVTKTVPELNAYSWRVAMITTKTPSEPFSMVKKTLEAMIAQKHIHDVWLGDEDPTSETIDWCTTNEVKIYTRKGNAEYNRTTWPRRARCKEGNLAYFYDTYGYKDYDIVVQLDSDHVPSEGYLEAMLTPFIDNRVGYVSAPSICDTNAKTSWSARGRLYMEASLHGPLQAGYTGGFAPLCIGSHYAVRTTALKEIGGIGPELAEDHSTSLMMQAYGWKGVHALDAIAHGDGPVTFADCMKQEFQWARSLTIVLLVWLPKFWKMLTPKLKFQFLFAELWYTLFSISMLLGSLLSVVALFTGIPWVNVNYGIFFLFSLAFSILALLVASILKNKNLLRPIDSPLISWEMIVYQLVRWPWELIGIWAGITDSLFGKNFDIHVTPKGSQTFTPLPTRVLSPYIVLIIVYIVTALGVSNPEHAQGYYFFVLIGLVAYVCSLLTIIIKHRSESREVSQQSS